MFDLRIKTFLLVVELGSFSKAAKKEFRSTVAIMNQITSLEKELDVQLLVRSPRGVTPTPAGQRLFDGTKILKNNADQLIAEVKQISNVNQKIIRVGTSLLRPSDKLINLWLANKGRHKSDFQFQLIPFVDDFKYQNKILTNNMDCLVTPYSVRAWNKIYSYLPLGMSECQIGVSKNNPLFSRTSLSWTDLNDQKLFLLKKGESALVDQIRNEIEQKHPQIKIYDMSHLYDINSFNQVILNKGLVELPSFWANIHPEIKLLPMSWNYHIPYGLLYHKHPSKIMQEFIQEIKDFMTA